MTASKTVTRAHLKTPSAAAIAGLVVSCLLIAAFWLLRIGKELTDHRRFTLATNIDVYFCDPQSAWQRGSNENTQPTAEAVLPEGDRLVGAFANLSEQSGSSGCIDWLSRHALSHPVHCGCCAGPICGARTGFAIP